MGGTRPRRHRQGQGRSMNLNTFIYLLAVAFFVLAILIAGHL